MKSSNPVIEVNRREGILIMESSNLTRWGGPAGSEAHFSAKIARRLMSFFSARSAAPAQVFPELTAREREILDLIARGCNNQEIARELYLSPKTVRNHISNIFTKLQVADRAQAIIRACEAGLGRNNG